MEKDLLAELGIEDSDDSSSDNDDQSDEGDENQQQPPDILSRNKNFNFDSM